jgi:hypothetical protein
MTDSCSSLYFYKYKYLHHSLGSFLEAFTVTELNKIYWTDSHVRWFKLTTLSETDCIITTSIMISDITSHPRNTRCLEPDDGSCQPVTFSLSSYLCCSFKHSFTFHILIFGTTCKMIMLNILCNIPDITHLQYDQNLVG